MDGKSAQSRLAGYMLKSHQEGGVYPDIILVFIKISLPYRKLEEENNGPTLLLQNCHNKNLLFCRYDVDDAPTRRLSRRHRADSSFRSPVYRFSADKNTLLPVREIEPSEVGSLSAPMRLNELAKNDSHHLLGALCMPVPTSNTVRVLQFDEPVVETTQTNSRGARRPR